MSKSIADRIEELALLTVMLHAGDTQGIDVIRTLLQELQACAKQEDGFAPLIEACESVLAQKTDEPERVIETINKFISGAQAFLGDPSKTFDVGAKDLQWGDDLSTHADPELIVEFIEKHTTMLDDLEAAIMQIANADQPEEHELAEFQGYVKSYLHNIKGDAGSVGLQGIERVTHSLEDRLLEISAHKFLDQLLLYREWVIQVMNAYTQGHTPTELSHDVLPKLADNKDNALVDSVEQKPAAQETQQKAFVSRSYTIGGDVEILSEFLIEAEEHLGSIETLLLEKEEGFDKEDLDTIFRAMHSIKGGSSYFNLQDITTTSHAAENLMDKARNGQLLFNTALKSIVLRYIDMQRSLLDAARTAVTKDGLLHTLPEVSDFLEIIADYLEAIRMIEQIDFLESSASQIQEEQGLEESGDASVVESAPKVDLAD
ncbi:MAG: Hpt domain-containing protein, partial [Bdellovibrionales bacterium]|nr:Hpt domain-containing protein [Bdellovibrionales bacterium]